jgi:hypothetical protein
MFSTAICTATFFFAKDTSIIMRIAITGVHLADRATGASTAVLSALPRSGYKGDTHRVTRAQGDAQVALPT